MSLNLKAGKHLEMKQPLLKINGLSERSASAFLLLSLFLFMAVSTNTLMAGEAVRVGYYDFKPLVYQKDNGKPAGIYIDIIKEIADREDWDLNFLYCNWPECLNKLEEGKLDLLTAILSSPERDKKFAFNEVSVLSTWGQLCAGPDVEVKSFLDLKGKHIAVVENGYFYPQLKKKFDEFNVEAEFVHVDKYQRVFEMVENGEADVCSAERFTAHQAIHQFDIQLAPVIYKNKEFKFGAPENSSAILSIIDEHLEEMKAGKETVFHRSLRRHLREQQSSNYIPSWLWWVLLAGFAVLIITVPMVFYLRYLVRKKTAALRHREENHRLTLQSIGDAVIATDNQGRITRMNQVAESLTGWQFEEARGKSLTEVFSVVNAETREAVIDPVQDVLAKGKIRGLANHTVLVARDGSERQIADSASPIQDDNGQVVGVVLVFQDVTEQYRQQEALQEKEALLEHSQAIAHVGTWVFNVNENHLKWSDEVYRIFGIQPQAFAATYEAFLDAVHPDDRAKVDRAYSESLKKPEDGYEIEHRVVRQDNQEISTVYEKCVHETDDQGKVVRSIGIVQDITELRRTEEELRENERRLSTLMSNLPGMAYRCLDKPEWPMEFVSEGCFDLTGYTAEELTTGQDLEYGNLVHPEDAEYLWNCVQKAIAEKRPFKVEYRIRKKQGEERWVWECGRRVNCDDSGTAFLEGFIGDITERKQAELELQKALDDLRKTQQQVIAQERQQALTTMASGIAHDFNNALSPIQGFADLLLDHPDLQQDSDKLTRYLEYIQKSATTAAETVRRMRKFYRPREETAFTPVDLNKVIEDAVAVTKPRWEHEGRASGRQIEIKTEPGTACTVSGDEAELHEMLTNLIFNSVDAMPEGGTITIRTFPENDFVVFEFSDNGEGMSEETKDKCFDPFYTTKGVDGSGLGLATLQGTVERHKGSVSVLSTEGKGTTFRIELPAISSEHGEQKNGQANDVPQMKILAVEEDESQRELLEQLLNNDGNSVDFAADGVEGLEKFNANGYDVVITDRAMPGMNGDQLAAEVKKTTPDKPVIMITGFGDMMDAAGEKLSSVDAVLSKPITKVKLQEALGRVKSKG